MHTDKQTDRQTDRGLRSYKPHRFTGGQQVQLSQRDPAAGWVSYGQNWKTGTGIQYFMDIIGLSSTTVT